MNEILNELILILKKSGLFYNVEKVTLESTLFIDLDFDFEDIVDIVMSIEQKYSISISENEANKFKTINDLVNIILIKKG